MKKIAKIISLSAIMLVGSSAISYADDGVQKAVDQISTNYKIESDLSSDDKLNNEETINSSKENSLDNENQNSVDKTIINEKESIDDESNEEKDSNLNYNNSKDNQEKIYNIEDKKDSTNITKNVENEESLSISDDKSFDNVKSQSNLNQKRFKIYKENGKIYCMNIDDNKLVDTGWIDYDGRRYFCKKNGELYVNQIITFGPKVAYYLGSNGYVLKSVFEDNGILRHSDINTGMLSQTGWIEENGKKYFSKNNFGELYRNQIITFGPKVAYYLGNNGYVLKSVFEDNGVLRHSDINTGILSQTGWIEENGKKYFSKNNFGELYRNQIITFGPKVAYYLGNNGYVLKSVFEDNGVLRHSDINTGILSQIGWIEENGKKYFSKNNFGELYVNQIITFGPKVSYYMGSDGSASKVSTGWFIKDGKTSYSFSDGSIAKGHVMINGLKYYFDNNGYLKSKVGIDISVWNEIVNWNEIKKAGIDFVIIRSSGSYASNGKLYKDSKFDSHIRGALNAGLQVGIYHYSQAITRDEAILEARYVDSIIRPYKSKLTLPVAFDRELYSESNGYYGRTYKIGKEKDAEVSLAFLDEITRLGYKGSFYSYTSYLNNQINMNKISPKYPVWVAQYNYKCDYKGPYTTWQYSSQGKVNGIRGNVDMNIMYV
ncbi:GH25 family lysozyme [Anaerococcus vaginalis]|uniref:GH25 family lysozyme n=2 Tax=Anaerococcus TaxID=165779 RepID=UPI00290468EE|nr:GH25 family lysozyme [Anaerococcus vaginalis]MDU1031096.1 GH25 family lysozyme [Anaerococcus vaginalis]